MTRRIAPGEAGERWVHRLRDGDGRLCEQWQAGVWVRERDGRRRCVRVLRATRDEADAALDAQLKQRIGRGVLGVTAHMTVAELAEHWLQTRMSQVQVPVADQARGAQGGPVAPQTLAGYQYVITRVIVPYLGGLRVEEARAGILDEVLRTVADQGRATGLVHTVLKQMFSLAVRHDALVSNPMREVDRPRRRRGRVHPLTVEQVHDLLWILEVYTAGHAVDQQGRKAGGRARSPVVRDMVVFLLATGCRVGEALAVTWRDLDLASDPPTVHIAATLVEPRKHAIPGNQIGGHKGHTGRRGHGGHGEVDESGRRVFVETLHRQPITKSGAQRTLVLPQAAVAMLLRRRRSRASKRLDAPVFENASGGWLSPTNPCTKLRTMLAGTEFEGVSPHVLRRTVGTHLAHEAGLQTAREVLGHVDTSVTWRHYVAPRTIGPDVRELLDAFFELPHGR